MTRWQRFYLEDPRIASASPTLCVKRASELFKRYRKRVILEVACGIGRDSLALAEADLIVYGIDAARSGLTIAQTKTAALTNRPTFIEADARRIPFASSVFEGVYCFGLLHEFVGDGAEADVCCVMGEINRVLSPMGLLVLTVLSGEPQRGLPQVQLFTESMFDRAVACFQVIEKQVYCDIGCTGCNEYKVWYWVCVKRPTDASDR